MIEIKHIKNFVEVAKDYKNRKIISKIGELVEANKTVRVCCSKGVDIKINITNAGLCLYLNDYNIPAVYQCIKNGIVKAEGLDTSLNLPVLEASELLGITDELARSVTIEEFDEYITSKLEGYVFDYFVGVAKSAYEDVEGEQIEICKCRGNRNE